VVGGHTASGYWVDTGRQTTIGGLWAAGDAAGGCPQKYVSGAMAEAEIASEEVLKYLQNINFSQVSVGGLEKDLMEEKIAKIVSEAEGFLSGKSAFSISELEEAMQKVMDEEAGGISAGYRYSLSSLERAGEKINELIGLSNHLFAADLRELMAGYELKERLTVSLALIKHMAARQETRWPGFSEFIDFPDKNDSFLGYINSKFSDKGFEIKFRKLITGENIYEHLD
jgi:adenylylsulfate reductase subunit A